MKQQVRRVLTNSRTGDVARLGDRLSSMDESQDQLYVNWEWWGKPTIAALGKQRQGDQECKVVVGHITDPVSKQTNKQQQKQTVKMALYFGLLKGRLKD